MHAFDGHSEADRQLWHSYVHLARRHAIASGGQAAGPAIVDDPKNLIGDQLAEAFQTILFSSFALEYRLKRVLIEMGRPPGRTTLSPLFNGFWETLGTVERIDGKGKCAPPAQWTSIEPSLKNLISLRNQMAHANYAKVLGFLGDANPPKHAREYYNAVVEAIMLINIGTGYETGQLAAVREHFSPLRVVG